MKKLHTLFSRHPANYAAAAVLGAGPAVLAICAQLQDSTGQGWYLPVTILIALSLGVLAHLKPIPQEKAMALSAVWDVLWGLLTPFLTILLVQHFTCDPTRIYPKMLVANLALYVLLYLGLSFLTGTLKWGYLLSTTAFLIIGTANYFVVQFRSGPIVPWDLLSLRTAASVAGNYTYDISWRFVWTILGFAALLVCAMKMRFRLRRISVRAAGVILCAALLVLGTGALQRQEVKDWLEMDTTLFTPTVRYRNNGFLAAFLGNLHLIDVQKPDGYSVEAVEALLEQTQQEMRDAAPSDDTQLPNIIIIMNEAFSDLQVRGSFGVDHDYMPTFRTLMQEQSGGHLMVSVKGGNTANTEYEFLSGDTMAFLPQGSVPYQQFIHDEVPALPSYLRSLGYETVGIHPYKASGWDRDKVYPLLGFDTFLSVKDFSHPRMVRDFISDESAFDKIIEVFEAHPSQPKFIFEVTMQNHSGYSKEYPGFTETVQLTDLGYSNTQTRAVEKYLTLIETSDQSLAKLMAYFETVEEPTIIAMFGDHQPGDYITHVIDRMTGYDPDSEDLEEAQKAYIVPYFVWNNFGMELPELELTSPNYLGADILAAAHIPLTAYQTWLLGLQEQLPVVCAGTYIDAEGTYHAYAEQDPAHEKALNDYNILTYNHLTDGKNRVAHLFTS